MKSLGFKCGTIAEILLYLFPVTISVKMKNIIFIIQELNSNHYKRTGGYLAVKLYMVPRVRNGEAGNGGRPERKEATAGLDQRQNLIDS